MAKTSMLMREKHRQALVKKHAQKRAKLKEIIRSPGSSPEQRVAAQADAVVRGGLGAVYGRGRGRRENDEGDERREQGEHAVCGEGRAGHGVVSLVNVLINVSEVW